MGFGDADIRGSHTIRIFGTNRAGDLLPDIWLDLERIDVFRITTQHAGRFQGMYRRLYWMDDPARDDYNENGNPARTEGLKKFCSPDEADQENPEQWVPVRTIIEMSFNESTDHAQRSGRRGNRTSADNQVRIVEARRCFHRDTSIDDAAQAAADEGLKAYVVASNEYDFVEGSEDKENFIEVQYVSSTLEQSSAKEDEGKNQMVQTNWKNIHYLNFTDAAQGPVNPVHGFDPPWALDPFQAVVNVNFGGGGVFAAGDEIQAAGFNGRLQCLYDFLRSKTASNPWNEVTTFSGSDHVYDLRCGVYGNKDTGVATFVLAGNDTAWSGGGASFVWHGFIVTSTDGGKTWTRTYTSSNGFAQAAAYHEAAGFFYVQLVDAAVGEDFDTVVLRSSDGISWTEIEREHHSAGSGLSHAHAVVTNACSDIYQDGDGYNCPGGIYGHDKAKRIVIAPFPKIQAFLYSGRSTGEQIQILRFDESGSQISSVVKSISGLGRVSSVSYVGGIWMASGSNDVDSPAGTIACSTDNGDSWEIRYSHAAVSNVAVVLGAPKGDFTAEVLEGLGT